MLIRIHLIGDNLYEIEAEPLVIEGFEEISLAVHRGIRDGELSKWKVTELTTGYCIRGAYKTKREAIAETERKLKAKGLEAIRTIIASVPPLPEKEQDKK